MSDQPTPTPDEDQDEDQDETPSVQRFAVDGQVFVLDFGALTDDDEFELHRQTGLTIADLGKFDEGSPPLFMFTVMMFLAVRQSRGTRDEKARVRYDHFRGRIHQGVAVEMLEEGEAPKGRASAGS